MARATASQVLSTLKEMIEMDEGHLKNYDYTYLNLKNFQLSYSLLIFSLIYCRGWCLKYVLVVVLQVVPPGVRYG
jgi:hypothetical protein